MTPMMRRRWGNGTRPGYKTMRKSMNLGDGATGELEVNLEEDPAALTAEGGMLALDISEEEAVIFIRVTSIRLLFQLG